MINRMYQSGPVPLFDGRRVQPTAGGRLRRSEATGCERRRPKGGGSPEASPDGLGRGGQDPKKGFFLGPRRRSEATTEGGDGRRGEKFFS